MVTTTRAPYDEFADWYERYVTADAAGFTAPVGEALRRVLGPGRGPLLGPGLRHRRARDDPPEAGLDPVRLGHLRRARVGATHLPLGELIGAVLGAGLVLAAVVELGEPTPDVLAIRAVHPRMSTVDVGGI